MSDAPAIIAEQVSKRFRRGRRADSLRDWVGGLLRGGRGAERFWGVRDVSFQVRSGQAFGIIGPNGAGKSTLLKLLAGIMRPTSGSLAVRGRISALIELGAGFHPDLTGRENIHLNAAILGMTRGELRQRFDAIVDFAGVRDALDSPIKHYSSGMHARLGFAIAAHVEPDVLLVDEVLSVGDRVFRQRCMDRMREFLRRGVAVVFVSHDLGMVSTFCHEAMLLAAGEPIFIGPAAHAVARYQAASSDMVNGDFLREGPGASVREVRIRRPGEAPDACFAPGELIEVEYLVRFATELPRPSYGLGISRAEDQLCVFETSSTRICEPGPAAEPGQTQRVRYRLRLNLLPGEYGISVHVRDRDDGRYLLINDAAARFRVVGQTGTGGVAHLDPQVSVSIEPRVAIPSPALVEH